MTHDTDEQVISDTERTRVLESFGFHIIRVSNTDVYQNLEGVLELIHGELNPV